MSAILQQAVDTALTEADAQDAGGSYFEHILLCTTSVAYGHWASLVSVSGTYGVQRTPSSPFPQRRVLLYWLEFLSH